MPPQSKRRETSLLTIDCINPFTEAHRKSILIMATEADLKKLYAAYRHTSDIDEKGQFFSPSCIQICRTQPAYAATNRETIVRYLHESASDAPKPKGCYTIRPLRADEFEFSTDETVKAAGFETARQLKEKAESEGWVGMRVDLWSGDIPEGMLVKVQYWWKKEAGTWMQILHDIMYLGPRDGTEGTEGEILE